MEDIPVFNFSRIQESFFFVYKPKGQSRLDNQETQTSLGTRNRTNTSKTNYTTQKTQIYK